MVDGLSTMAAVMWARRVSNAWLFSSIPPAGRIGQGCEHPVGRLRFEASMH